MKQQTLRVPREEPEEGEITGEEQLDDAERAELHAALREGYEQARRGETVSAEELFNELRRRRG